MSTIPDEILALKMPSIEDVVIIGGGAMELYGLRKANDIDLVVSLQNWRYLRDKKQWKQSEKPRFRQYLADESGRFDVWRWWFNPTDESRTKLAELKSRSWQHHAGFYIPKPDLQLKLKLQLGRARDREDISLLQKYLKHN